MSSRSDTRRRHGRKHGRPGHHRDRLRRVCPSPSQPRPSKALDEGGLLRLRLAQRLEALPEVVACPTSGEVPQIDEDLHGLVGSPSVAWWRRVCPRPTTARSRARRGRRGAAPGQSPPRARAGSSPRRASRPRRAFARPPRPRTPRGDDQPSAARLRTVASSSPLKSPQELAASVASRGVNWRLAGETRPSAARDWLLIRLRATRYGAMSSPIPLWAKRGAGKGLAPQVGLVPSAVRTARWPEDSWGAATERMRGSGSSGRTRTYNPPVNSFVQVYYLVGSSRG